MSTVKQLLDSLLWDIYGKQQVESSGDRLGQKRHKNMSIMATSILSLRCGSTKSLEKLSVLKLVDICAILKVELRLMGYVLERVLISRDRNIRHQEILCEFVDAILHVECQIFHCTATKKTKTKRTPTNTLTSQQAIEQGLSRRSRTSALPRLYKAFSELDFQPNININSWKAVMPSQSHFNALHNF